LVTPSDGRPTGVWYPREPFAGDEEAGARDRATNPHLWSVALIRTCSSCGAMFAIATEDFEFKRIDGSRGAVKEGQLTECTEDWLASNPQVQQGQSPADDGQRGDRAYGEWRMSIIKRITKEKLKPPAVAKILQARIDDWPKQREILEAEIAELEGTENWRDVG
jgi:hypothetical protein